MNKEPEIELSRRIQIKDLKKRVTAFDVEASATECKALAGRFGLPAMGSLRASGSISRLAKDRAIRIEGRISAALTYESVVSLEPFDAEIDEEFSEVLTDRSALDQETEIELAPDEEQMGILEEGGFDLGEVISQNLALLLDPHPRTPKEEASGEEVVWSDSEVEEERENPFSALAEMRERMKNGD